MKKIYLFLFCFLFSTFLFSQKEANNWVLGSGLWLDFNSNPPVDTFLSNYDYTSNNSPICISDKEGNLLFYAGNANIFDRNHDIMPNGNIDGVGWEVNSSYVIPKPNTDSAFYLLIISGGLNLGSLEWETTLNWKEIDMTLNAGLGDISPNSGGFIQDNPLGKITAVLHANLQDIWIITHDRYSNVYNSWLATENGISTTPVISNVGSVINMDISNVDYDHGQMKTSLKGNKIVTAFQTMNQVEIFDFDRSTGILFNEMIFEFDGFARPAGVEFSPSERYLYVSKNGSEFFNKEMLQLDLLVGNSSEILNSMTVFEFPNDFTHAGNLQLGVDGKIYADGSNTLGVFNAPDGAGVNCNFEVLGNNFDFFMPDNKFPSFFHVYLKSIDFTYEGICEGGTTIFTNDVFELNIDSIFWDFGDPVSGGNNFSNDLNPSHSFSGSGFFEVTLKIYAGSKLFFKNKMIQIVPLNLSFGEDTTLCANQLLNLDAVSSSANYLWSNDSTTSFININSPGDYWVELSYDNCIVMSDTISVSHISIPNLELGPPRGSCDFGFEIIDATDTSCLNCTYLWNTNSTSPDITVSTSGTYSVTITSPNGCTNSDDVSYTKDELSLIRSQLDEVCEGDENGIASVLIESGEPPFSFEWKNGDTLYFRNNLAPGSYQVTVTNVFDCVASAIFIIKEAEELSINVFTESDNVKTNEGEGSIEFQVLGGEPPYVFDWGSFGKNNEKKLEGLGYGIYPVTVSDNRGCEQLFELEVDKLTDAEILENIEIYPNPIRETLFVKINRTLFEDAEMVIYNAQGKSISIVDLGRETSDFEFDLNFLSRGFYFIEIIFNNERKIWKVVLSP
ncbi:MAG: T9SS type A sorting domain-containing protein [Saprospiraceae bacterium]